jgi:tetratricopeptide (TPR) repeat protein
MTRTTKFAAGLMSVLMSTLMVTGPAFAAGKGKGAKKPAAADAADDDSADMTFSEDEGQDVGKSGPPSKDLERAKKLYDKKDYVSASIEFQKVIKGETGDSEANRQKAEFFMGKTLYQMRFYAASLAYFDKITEQGPSHKYYKKTLQWLAALAKVLPESAGILEKIGKYTKEDLEDPALDSVRPELYYYLGRYFYRQGKLDDAIALFQAVPETATDWYIKAKFFEGITWVLVPKGQEAVDAFKQILIIAGTPSVRKKYKKEEVREYEELANLSMARVFHSTKQFETSIKYYEKLPQDSPDWLDTLFEASWAYFQLKRNSKALGNIHTLTAPYFENEFYPESVVLKAVIYFQYCRYDRALESVAEFQEEYPPIRDELRKIAKQQEDDDSEFLKYVKKIRSGTAGLPDRVQRLAETALRDRQLLKTFAYVDELERELNQYDKSDKSWKTTGIAAEVLQELTVQKSLAEAAAGHLARERIKRLSSEISELSGDARAVKIAVLEAKKGNIAAKFKKEQITKGHKNEPIIVDDEHQTWEFNGEYWKDELGFYRYRISSVCPENAGQ